MVAFISRSSPFNPATNCAARAAPSQMDAMHDADLVRRFRTGDDAAFTEIVVRHRAKLFAVALARLRNHADAEEITQDTFIRAHRALAAFRGESSLGTWLHRITVNLALNRYWYFFRRRRHLTQSLDCPLGDETSATLADVVASEAPGPVRQTMNNEFLQVVAACMTMLPPRQSEILRLRNGLAHSYDRIALTLGINVGTVKSRIARARSNLQTLIASTCPEYSTNATTAEWLTHRADGV